MREIKFRAWDIEEKKMYFVQTLDFGKWAKSYVYNALGCTKHEGHNRLCSADGCDNWKWLNGGNDKNQVDFTERVILMEYTGVKDKKGKEIFEGDIIQYKRREDDKLWHRDYSKVVENVAGGFAISHWLHEYEEKELKVIGNIYKNEELI